MTKLSKILILLLAVSLANAFNVMPALALIPPLPSSFYGTVKVNGENVADGTVIKAIINGQAYATGYTQTYQGASVYSVDVPGDDSSSTTVEGGRDGDVVQFEIAGVLAVETGIWMSATNVSVNLTASVAAPLNTPQPTPTSVPTQTPIKTQKKSPTSTTSVEALSVPATVVESMPTKIVVQEQALPQPTKPAGYSISNNPTEPIQVSPTPTQPVLLEERGSGNNIFMIVLIIILGAVVAWVLRTFRKPGSSQER